MMKSRLFLSGAFIYSLLLSALIRGPSVAHQLPKSSCRRFGNHLKNDATIHDRSVAICNGEASPPSMHSSWVRSHCNADPECQALLEIPPWYFEDPVLAGPIMDAGIKKFKIELDVQRAMLLMLGRSAPVKSDHSADTPTVDRIARELYGMFHAKYILTNAGLRAMRDKFLRCAYGTCPRVCCNRFPLLPLGLDDAPAVSKMQCFCASCRDIYEPPKPSQRSIDGAVFGTSFPHYFLHRNVDLAPTRPNQSYVPRMFGFRISPRAAELVKYRNE